MAGLLKEAYAQIQQLQEKQRALEDELRKPARLPVAPDRKDMRGKPGQLAGADSTFSPYTRRTPRFERDDLVRIKEDSSTALGLREWYAEVGGVASGDPLPLSVIDARAGYHSKTGEPSYKVTAKGRGTFGAWESELEAAS